MRHETYWKYSITTLCSKLCRITVLGNFEYILYRAKLASYEKDRLGFDTQDLEEILLVIEDQRLKEIKSELADLNTAGFEREAGSIKAKLRDVSLLSQTEKEFKNLKKKLKKGKVGKKY